MKSAKPALLAVYFLLPTITSQSTSFCGKVGSAGLSNVVLAVTITNPDLDAAGSTALYSSNIQQLGLRRPSIICDLHGCSTTQADQDCQKWRLTQLDPFGGATMLEPLELVWQQNTIHPMLSQQQNESHAADEQATRSLSSGATGDDTLVISIAVSCSLQSSDDSLDSTDVQANITAAGVSIEAKTQQQQRKTSESAAELHTIDSRNSQQQVEQPRPAIWSDTVQLRLLPQSAGNCPTATVELEHWLMPNPISIPQPGVDSSSSQPDLEVDSFAAMLHTADQHNIINAFQPEDSEQNLDNATREGYKGSVNMSQATSPILYLLELQLPDLKPLLDDVHELQHSSSSSSSVAGDASMAQDPEDSKGPPSCGHHHGDCQSATLNDITGPSSIKLWFSRLLLCCGLLGIQAAMYIASSTS